MQSRNTHRQRFPSVEENIAGSSWKSTGDGIELASQALLANGDNGAVRVVFVAYHQLNELLSMAFFSPEYESMLRDKNDKTQKSMDITDGSTAPSSPTTFLNSKVVCASLGRGRHIELPEPVIITLNHLKEINHNIQNSYDVENKISLSSKRVQESNSLPHKFVPKCVYWDYLSNYWSQDGCKVLDSNRTHTQCQCNHLTNFALLMVKENGNSHNADVYKNTDLHKNSGFLHSNSRYDVRPIALSPVKKAPMMSKNVSTIVASIATLISVCIIGFFIIMAWQKLRVSTQCRSALGKSGLPCFHKGGIEGSHGVSGGRNGHGNNNTHVDDNATEADSESAAGGKDKGNKGNFYTVTPKLTFNFNRSSTSGNNTNNNVSGNAGNISEDEETPELVEAQQFFEHMIALQKNQDNIVGGGNTNKSSRRASANLSHLNENLNQQEISDDQQLKLNNINLQNNNQRLSQQQVLVMNNLQSSNMNTTPFSLNGGVPATTNEIIYPKRNNYARALSPYNHIYMEISDGGKVVPGNNENNAAVHNDQPQQHFTPVYEPLSHLSETYMMSTLSDLSEDNYNFGVGLNYNSISDGSRQSSHRESRPLLRNNNNLYNAHSNAPHHLNDYSQGINGQQRNLLQTISGVLHSQSVRLSNGNNFTDNHGNNTNIGIRGASLHHINNGTRKGRGFATLHHPPNHSGQRKSVLGIQQQQHPMSNTTNQTKSSFMMRNTGGNLGHPAAVTTLNGTTILGSNLNGDKFVGVHPITGQAVSYNANRREAIPGQATYISSSLSDGGIIGDGNNVTANGVFNPNSQAQHRIAKDSINGVNLDNSSSPGSIVRQLLQQHRKDNAEKGGVQQYNQHNISTLPQSQAVNSISSSQAPITNAGPVSLPQPQFAHPIASATAAKI